MPWGRASHGIFISLYDKENCHFVLTRKVVNVRMGMTNKVVIIKRRGADIMALLNRLKEYRARLGINQTELGKLAGPVGDAGAEAGKDLSGEGGGYI